jgi:hypothetical protein
VGNLSSESSGAFSWSDRELNFFPGGTVDPEFAPMISVCVSDEDDEAGLLVFACQPAADEQCGRPVRVVLTEEYTHGFAEMLAIWLERRRRLPAA